MMGRISFRQSTAHDPAAASNPQTRTTLAEATQCTPLAAIAQSFRDENPDILLAPATRRNMPDDANRYKTGYTSLLSFCSNYAPVLMHYGNKSAAKVQQIFGIHKIFLGK